MQTKDLFWERLGTLLKTLGINPPEDGAPNVECVRVIDEAIKAVEDIRPQNSLGITESFLSCSDAKTWAEAFTRINPIVSQDAIHAWFAAAISAGYEKAIKGK
jgi:hypothetical protein